jgi:hypothetical protein
MTPGGEIWFSATSIATLLSEYSLSEVGSYLEALRDVLQLLVTCTRFHNRSTSVLDPPRLRRRHMAFGNRDGLGEANVFSKGTNRFENRAKSVRGKSVGLMSSLFAPTTRQQESTEALD